MHEAKQRVIACVDAVGGIPIYRPARAFPGILLRLNDETVAVIIDKINGSSRIRRQRFVKRYKELRRPTIRYDAVADDFTAVADLTKLPAAWTAAEQAARRIARLLREVRRAKQTRALHDASLGLPKSVSAQQSRLTQSWQGTDHSDFARGDRPSTQSKRSSLELNNQEDTRYEEKTSLRKTSSLAGPRAVAGVGRIDGLVCLWEKTYEDIKGQQMRLMRSGRLTPQYERVFERLARYLDETGISAEIYMRMISNRAKGHSPFNFYTKLLGTPFWNRIVDEQLAKHAQKRGVHSARNIIDEGYDRLRNSEPFVTSRELEQDVKQYVQARRLYRHMSATRFWQGRFCS